MADEKTESDAPAPAPARAWPVVIKLAVPIEFGKGRMIDTITMRRGTAGDMKGMKLGTEVAANDLILIASRLSGEPVAVIEKLDQDDSGEVLGVAMDFLGRCLVAGSAR